MLVFVSYSTQDREFVGKLVSYLRKQEISVWLDNNNICVGDNLPEAIRKGLNDANIFLPILSPESVDSEWCKKERDIWLCLEIEEQRIAKQESRTPNRRTIPIIYRDCEIPVDLKHLLNLSITEQNYIVTFDRLFEEIKRQPLENPLKYQTLEELLQNKQWQGADFLTLEIMLNVLGLGKNNSIDYRQLDKFPCQDFLRINELWRTHSNDRLGFSIQKEIYLRCGGRAKNCDTPAWRKFAEEVGWYERAKWYKKEKWIDSSIYLNQYLNGTNEQDIPKGYFPHHVVGGYDWDNECRIWISYMVSKFDNC
ncbi:MAG: GUN4 domain-containing protein [Nostocales cyanobacterium LE14-WE4]|nr:GUN4 domain-containing protein [Anabaena sp. 49633_E8]MCE2701235.1 GUN4 domain-containing protein [Anabaena sp. 49633_E8]MDJ0499577.1 GUN4 domain-containing protein [Nostocales cyanobacterium LE14-WE4]